MKNSLQFFSALLVILCLVQSIQAQVSINTDGSNPDASSILDIKSTDRGLLIPRLNQAERDAITSPAHSMMIYQVDISPGYYYNKGSAGAPKWVKVATDSRIAIDSIPYVITDPGSYYLTASLTQNSADDGITIMTSNVSLDLNGFSLIGDSGFSNDGIVLDGSIKNISIQNGNVTQWEGAGITGEFASGNHLKHLNIDANGYDGVFMGSNNIVENCHFSANGFDGLDLTDGNSIKECTFSNNDSDGLEVEENNTISHCTADNNGDGGIQVSLSNVIDQCASNANTNDGFDSGIDNHFSRCISNGNGGHGFELGPSNVSFDCHASDNTSHGFFFEAGSSISNSYAQGNTLTGFYSEDDNSRIENNHSTANSQNGFNITGSTNLIIKNKANDNTLSDYFISLGNYKGPIITGANIGTTYNANANITF